MTTFADAVRAIKSWRSAGAGAKGYADMIRAIKVWKAQQPKAFAKGGKVTVKKLSKPKLSRPVSAFAKGGTVKVAPKAAKGRKR